MYDKVLVPLDGSQAAEGVLPLVYQFLKRKDSEVVLLRVVPPVMAEGFVMYGQGMDEEETYLKGIAQRLGDAGARVRIVSTLGLAVETILEVASRESASLILMSSHGRSGFARLVFGSVTENVLRSSPIPVMVVTPEARGTAPDDLSQGRPIRTILVPIDGSHESLAVVKHAVDFARMFRSRIVLLRVMESETNGAKARILAEKQVESIAGKLRKAGVHAQALMERGDPATMILAVARFHDIDLIAMSTHGRSGISRLVVGSVTEQVLRKAKVPLLVVRSVPMTSTEAKKKKIAMPKAHEGQKT